jgi:hypothetical protein
MRALLVTDGLLCAGRVDLTCTETRPYGLHIPNKHSGFTMLTCTFVRAPVINGQFWKQFRASAICKKISICTGKRSETKEQKLVQFYVILWCDAVCSIKSLLFESL